MSVDSIKKVKSLMYGLNNIHTYSTHHTMCSSWCNTMCSSWCNTECNVLSVCYPLVLLFVCDTVCFALCYRV